MLKDYDQDTPYMNSGNGNLLQKKQTATIYPHPTLSPSPIIENMPLGFILLRTIKSQGGNVIDFRIANTNMFFERRMRLSKDEMLGKSIRDVIPELEDKWIEMFMETIRTNESRIEEAYSSVFNAYLRISTGIPHADMLAVYMDDISELKLFEHRLLAIKEKELEADKLKSAFLDNMSHELRTPMNAIVGFTDLISMPNLPVHKLGEYTNEVHQSCNKLIDLVTDVIEMAQIQAKLTSVQKTSFKVADLLTKLFLRYSDKAKSKNIALVLDLDQPVNTDPIFTDEDKLCKILSHLLDNAIKFTEDGSVKLGYKHSDGYMSFSVTDTGIGISKQIQPRIFEPFLREERNASKFYSGTGLGLAIVKSYCEMLDGVISLDSEVNQGTQFKLTIPTRLQRGQYHGLAEQDKPDLRNKMILIAEDDEANYHLIYEMLEGSGAKIIHAADGHKALGFCRGNSELDFVIMDLRMPIMDGYTATRLIKGFRPELPVVALTLFDKEQNQSLYLKSGFDDYLMKPIDKQRLYQVFTNLL